MSDALRIKRLLLERVAELVIVIVLKVLHVF